jgi:hypothetical protein
VIKDLLGIYYPAMTLIFKLTSVLSHLFACESEPVGLSLNTLLLPIGFYKKTTFPDFPSVLMALQAKKLFFPHKKNITRRFNQNKAFQSITTYNFSG